jgi:hypothetical protein
MSTNMQGRGDRFERIVRGLLGLALLAGVAWALTHGGPAPDAGLALTLR